MGTSDSGNGGKEELPAPHPIVGELLVPDGAGELFYSVPVGRFADHIFDPYVLPIKYIDKHPIPADWGNTPVVMYVDGIRRVGGYQPGVHDGIRDGYSSSHINLKNTYVCYTLLSGWLDAECAQSDDMGKMSSYE